MRWDEIRLDEMRLDEIRWLEMYRNAEFGQNVEDSVVSVRSGISHAQSVRATQLAALVGETKMETGCRKGGNRKMETGCRKGGNRKEEGRRKEEEEGRSRGWQCKKM